MSAFGGKADIYQTGRSQASSTLWLGTGAFCIGTHQLASPAYPLGQLPIFGTAVSNSAKAMVDTVLI